jgi:hypothetical protein
MTVGLPLEQLGDRARVDGRDQGVNGLWLH